MKVLFLVNSREYARSYLETCAFKDVSSLGEISLYVEETIDLKQYDTSYFSKILKREKDTDTRIGQYLFDLYMINLRKKHPSFAFRVKRKFPNTYWQWKYLRRISVAKPNNIGTSDISVILNKKKNRFVEVKLQKIKFLRNYLSGKLRKFLFFFFASKLVFPISRKVLRTLFRIETINKNKIDFSSYDLIIIPSSGYESFTLGALECARRDGTKTMLLIDNWDNLSSKSFLWIKPDFLCAWGPQSVEHAIRIQKMDPECCLSIGTPRIDRYFGRENLYIKSIYDFEYILFAGSSVEYKESDYLEILDYELSKYNDLHGRNIKIVYRPHPLRGGWKMANFNNLKNTILDNDLVAIVESGDIRWNSKVQLPSLENYISLFKNSLFVVSGLTSMLIESCIFNKKTLAIAVHEEDNLTSPHSIYKEYEHFRGIDNIPSLTIIKNLENLRKEFWDSLNQKDYSWDNSKEIQYFIYHDEDTYSKRLKKTIRFALEPD